MSTTPLPAAGNSADVAPSILVPINSPAQAIASTARKLFAFRLYRRWDRGHNVAVAYGAMSIMGGVFSRAGIALNPDKGRFSHLSLCYRFLFGDSSARLRPRTLR